MVTNYKLTACGSLSQKMASTGAPAGIYLFEIDLCGCDDPCAALSLLSAEEIERARRFVNDTARRNFIFMRATLRAILGDFLSRSGKNLLFEYNEFGKPFVTTDPKLDFNVSHSAGRGLVAISERGPVGIDLEPLCVGRSLVDEGRGILSQWEAEQLAGLAHPEWSKIFTRIWTRKEAVLKFIGCGFSGRPDRFSVSISETARIVESSISSVDGGLGLMSLDLGSGYEGCLAFT